MFPLVVLLYKYVSFILLAHFFIIILFLVFFQKEFYRQNLYPDSAKTANWPQTRTRSRNVQYAIFKAKMSMIFTTFAHIYEDKYTDSPTCIRVYGPCGIYLDKNVYIYIYTSYQERKWNSPYITGLYGFSTNLLFGICAIYFT